MRPPIGPPDRACRGAARPRLMVVAAVLALLGLLAGLAWRADLFHMAAPSDPWTLRPQDAAVIALGEQVYRAHCASCHGAWLEGQPGWRIRGADGLLPAPPHDASGHTWHHGDHLLVRLTRLGPARALDDPGYRSAMPAFEGVLSDGEIVAVLSWIKSTWPPELQAHQDAVSAQEAGRSSSR